MTPRRQLAVAIAIGLSTVACGPMDDTNTDDTGDTGPPPAQSYAWKGSYSGFDFAKATLDVTPRADGGESLESTTVLDFLGFLAVRLEITEQAEVGPDGDVESWVQQARHTLGDTELEFRYEVDAAAGEALQGIADHYSRFEWAAEGTPVLYPYPSDPVFDYPYPSPMAGRVIGGALRAGHDLAFVVPFYHLDVEVPNVALPTAGDDGVCAGDEWWVLLGDQYCTSDDGELLAFMPGSYGIAVTRTEDDVEVDPVSVPLPSHEVVPPDCAIPAPGARHVDFVVSSADSTTIAGRMLLPEGAGPFPAVTINAGTGGSDRSGFIVPMPHWDCIAASLLEDGIAVVTYDDRGWGASGGEINDSFSGRTDDAIAVASWALDRSEIGSLYLVGHSEGVAHVCAAAPYVDDAGLVLVSGVADTGAELWVGQIAFYLAELGFPTNQISQIVAQRQQIVSQVQAGTYPQDSIGGWPVDGFWDEFFDFDGISLARATSGPVLVLQGGMDWQVPQDQGTAMYEALDGDDRDVTLEAFAGLGHLMQPAVGGVAAGLEYHLPWSWSPEVTTAMGDWISAQEAR